MFDSKQRLIKSKIIFMFKHIVFSYLLGNLYSHAVELHVVLPTARFQMEAQQEVITVSGSELVLTGLLRSVSSCNPQTYTYTLILLRNRYSVLVVSPTAVRLCQEWFTPGYTDLSA